MLKRANLETRESILTLVQQSLIWCRIDMSKPILEIFAELKARPGFDEHIPAAENWPAMIEQNAPGYLALEAEGRGDEYDHSLFSDKMG